MHTYGRLVPALLVTVLLTTACGSTVSQSALRAAGDAEGLGRLGLLDDDLSAQLEHHAEVDVLGGGVKVGRDRARGAIERY